MDYDNDVLGVGNSQHPANEQDYIFESDDLDDCMEYYKNTGIIEPLENAINKNRKLIREAKKIIDDTVSVLKSSNRSDLALIIYKIKL